MAGAGAGVALGLMALTGVAFAGDSAQKSTVTKAASAAAPSQTASLGTNPSQSMLEAPALKLDIDPFRFDQQVAKDLGSALTPQAAPTAPPSALGPETGARFVPMLRKSASEIDPDNRGNFFDNHEVGIELKSDF